MMKNAFKNEFSKKTNALPKKIEREIVEDDKIDDIEKIIFPKWLPKMDEISFVE